MNSFDFIKKSTTETYDKFEMRGKEFVRNKKSAIETFAVLENSREVYCFR